MTTRTSQDRANQSISDSHLTENLTIKADPAMVERCERLNIFHRQHKTSTSPTLSQWIYDQMARALPAAEAQPAIQGTAAVEGKRSYGTGIPGDRTYATEQERDDAIKEHKAKAKNQTVKPARLIL